MVAQSPSDADSPCIPAFGLPITCFIIAIILRQELSGLISLRFGRCHYPGSLPRTSILIVAGAAAGALAIGLPALADPLLAGTAMHLHIKSIKLALFAVTTVACAAGVVWGLLSRQDQ